MYLRDTTLEHRIRVRRLVRDDLEHIPVLHDFPVGIQPEDVYPGPFLVLVGGPFLITMQHHIVPLGNHSLEGYVFAGVLPGHELEIGDECLFTLGHMRVVLK